MYQNKFTPNSFQVPNSIIDEFLSSLSSTATKCYLFICRKTTGWNKLEDSISISQFQTYLNIKDDRTITKALKELSTIGLIKAKRTRGKVTKYSLIVNPSKSKLPTNNDGTKMLNNSTNSSKNRTVTPKNEGSFIAKPPTKEPHTLNEVGAKNVPTFSQPKVPPKNGVHNIPIQKEEEKEEENLKYIKTFLDKILADDVAYEVFALDFYDYIYPNNKKSLQQKVWYGNAIKSNILEQDISTLKNIKSFLEIQEMEKIYLRRGKNNG